MTKFPNVLAAAKQIELDQWGLGEALLKDCGPPAECSAGNSDDFQTLMEVADELREVGIDYDHRTLGQFRNTAFYFKGKDRKKGVSFTAHAFAKRPEFLKAVVEGASTGTAITPRLVRDIRNAAHDADLGGMYAKRPNLPEPPAKRPDLAEPRIVPAQVIGLQFVVELGKARKEVERIAEAFAEDVGRIGETELACINRDFLAIAEVSRKAAAIKRTRPMAVGE